MNAIWAHCPQPPDWKLAWEPLSASLPWIEALRGCPQDPIHHAEGDVWIHTGMVCEALAELPAWRGLDAADRQTLFAAALLHDVAKPECTRVEPDGRVTSRGHSRRGAIRSRNLLWRLGIPFDVRESVANLVRHHQAPYFLIDRPDAEHLAIEISQTVRCDHLAILAEADVRGRICADRTRLLDNVALFGEQCRQLGCLNDSYPFPSDHTRFVYFRETNRRPDVPVHEGLRSTVTLMSGLPGSGKDTWLRRHAAELPVVSLDVLREELEIDPRDSQGAVVQAGREQAREHLRKGRSFAWNATNLSRQVRGDCIRLLHAYDARVRIVYVETDAESVFARNADRDARVPVQAIERMLERWEVPDRTEAHELIYRTPRSDSGSD